MSAAYKSVDPDADVGGAKLVTNDSDEPEQSSEPATSSTREAQDPRVVQDEEVTYKGAKVNNVAQPVNYAARAATLGSRWNALNWTWGFVTTMLVPAVGSIVWFGVIPVGDPLGGKDDKAVWVFLINPLTMAFFSFLLVTLFFTAISEKHPHRPLLNYVHIPALACVTQMIFPGLYVLFEIPFELLALYAIASVFVVSLLGLRFTPHTWLDCNRARYFRVLKVFSKISIVFCVYSGVLAAYMIANAEATGYLQGLLTVALNVLGFIFKKILLAFTDPVSIETAMLISGFWLENLTDVFITLAFPTAERFGVTFAIIFVTRIVENFLYLWFQLDIWFKFRVWIKGKFKKEQARAIEEDLPEYEDDRGHSAHHPGYRRRQLRFIMMKLFSQISSYIYFIALVPVLRFGPNKRRFPFSEPPGPPFRDGDDEPSLIDSYVDYDIHFLSVEKFERACTFAVVQIVAVLIGGAGIWIWMHHYCQDIIVQVRKRYNAVVIQTHHYGLVLSIMLANSLIATAYVNIYYRIYFV